MFRFAATSTLALVIGAAPVMANVTPAQVWENLQKTYADYGYEVSGAVEDAGGTLTVRDAVLSRQNDGGNTAITVPQLTLQETGDAKVRVVIDGDVTLNSTFEVAAPAEAAEDAPTDGTAAPTDPALSDPAPADPAPADPTAAPQMVPMSVTGTLRVPGNEMLVSGTADDMLYEYSYPSVVMDMRMPVGPQTDATMPVNAALTDLTGTQRVVAGDGSDTTFDLRAAEGSIAIDGDVPADPEGTGGGTLNLQARMADLAATGTIDTPSRTFDLNTQMVQALAAGLNIGGSFAFASMEASLDFTAKGESGEDQTGTGKATVGAADMALTMSEQGMGYTGSTTDIATEMTVSTVPFPISYAADRTSFDILFPISRADAAQSFKLAYGVEGLTFAEGIWNLFDPGSQLPRDPASVTVDLAGDVVMTSDLFDPAMSQPQPGTPPAPPFVPQTLTVNKVALDAVGAKADITGELKFGANPNEPVGTLDGTFEGVNGLLDKLVSLGFLPQERVMAVRMMLTMFARPAEGNPDQLTSTIEFREGGQIFANGQQVK